MKKFGAFIIIIAIIFLLALNICGVFALRTAKELKEKKDMVKQSEVVLYEGPRSLRDAVAEDLENVSEDKRDYSLLHCTDTFVTVNGQECYVYDTNVNHTRSWYGNYLPPQSRTPVAIFDFEGAVDVEVRVPDRELDKVKISPLSAGIEPQINKDAHTVSFRLVTPGNYTLQFDDSPERALHIFTNHIEKEEDKPDPQDPNVICFGPGEWTVDSLSLSKGQTLYLAGGCVLHTNVNANFISDVKVCGRGILDGSAYECWKGREAYVPLKFGHCKGTEIRDIVVLNSNAWVVEAYDCEDGVIDGLRIISSRPNGDGMSIQSCAHYKISNCFVRSWDDSLVVKNYDLNSDDIVFRDMQLWTDLAQSMEIGFETNKGKKPNATITNVTFEDITVLNNYHKPVISVHNADDALVEDILFRNIVVEHEEVGSGDSDLPYLIDIGVVQNNNWSSTPERGQIRGVSLENVNFMEGNDKYSRIAGFDAEHIVDDVTVKGLVMFGNEVRDADEAKIKISENTVGSVKFE